MNPPETRLGGAAPIFRVEDLSASLRYFVDQLGFSIDWDYRPYIASVTRDRCCIFLSQGDQGHPGAWTWIGVGDAELLHTELRSRGARIRQRPTNHRWALEMQVEDLDGNVLRIGSDPLAGQPYGEWLDMHGRAHPPSPDGES